MATPPIELAKWPAVKAYYERLRARPSVAQRDRGGVQAVPGRARAAPGGSVGYSFPRDRPGASLGPVPMARPDRRSSGSAAPSESAAPAPSLTKATRTSALTSTSAPRRTSCANVIEAPFTATGQVTTSSTSSIRAGLRKSSSHRPHHKGKARRLLLRLRKQRMLLGAHQPQMIGAPALHEAQIIGVIDNAGKIGVLVIDADLQVMAAVADRAVQSSGHSTSPARDPCGHRDSTITFGPIQRCSRHLAVHQQCSQRRPNLASRRCQEGHRVTFNRIAAKSRSQRSSISGTRLVRPDTSEICEIRAGCARKRRFARRPDAGQRTGSEESFESQAHRPSGFHGGHSLVNGVIERTEFPRLERSRYRRQSAISSAQQLAPDS